MYSPEQRKAIMDTVYERVSAGTPLAEVARADGMPNLVTIYDWLNQDQEQSQRFARAREAGYDMIAVDALKIADDGSNDTYIDADGNRRVDSDVIQRSKLRVETRLKLLAKWDPKRYGDKIAIGGASDLPPVQSNVTIDAAEAYKQLLVGEVKP